MDDEVTNLNHSAQLERLIRLITENKGLLGGIGEEIEQLVAENGGDKAKATLTVMQRHQTELEKIISDYNL